MQLFGDIHRRYRAEEETSFTRPRSPTSRPPLTPCYRSPVPHRQHLQGTSGGLVRWFSGELFGGQVLVFLGSQRLVLFRVLFHLARQRQDQVTADPGQEGTDGAEHVVARDVIRNEVGGAAVGSGLHLHMALEEVEDEACDEVPKASAKQLCSSGEAHGIRGLHILGQQLPLAILKASVDRPERGSQQGGNDVEGLHARIVGMEHVDKRHCEAYPTEGDDGEGRDTEAPLLSFLGLKGGRRAFLHLGNGSARLCLLGRSQRIQCCSHGGSEEEVDGDEAKVHLQRSVVVHADEIAEHEEEKEGRRRPEAVKEYGSDGTREAAPVRAGPGVGISEILHGQRLRECARSVLRPGLRGFLADEEERWNACRKHQNQVGLVQPTVVPIGDTGEHAVACDTADQELDRFDGARKFELRLGQHFGTDGLCGHIVEAFPHPPDQYANKEEKEMATRGGPMAKEDANAGHDDASLDEETAADSE
mmetsp:Transcript_92108/g.197369  ORF Transcript_92108/g.197369 Transcript_92108/m.197369 type:complete len:476 (-) Transcript_92108:974-2401(-)